MKHTLTGEEALKEFNKNAENVLSKLEQEEFNRKIQQVALDMRLSVQQCEPDSVPEFVQQSNSRLYVNELVKAPEPSPAKKEEIFKIEDDDRHQFFKDIYHVTCENSSSFFVMQNGMGSRMVSDHWTEESIDKCAEMASKLGAIYQMIPSGEPGAFPDHLRAYASQAFAKHGLQLPDPTPPTVEQVAKSKKQYELSSNQSGMKDKIAAMRSNMLGDNVERADSESRVTPFSTP